MNLSPYPNFYKAEKTKSESTISMALTDKFMSQIVERVCKVVLFFNSS